LIVTASNETQARAYESQLKVRQDIGLLGSIRNVMVVPDPGGKRIGSGGSTLYCLIEVLNRQLDPNSSNDEIESLFERVRPFIFGAKLLGGGGGFMLVICKSVQDARSVQEMLEANPPNERAKFFDFDISNEGLTVTVC